MITIALGVFLGIYVLPWLILALVLGLVLLPGTILWGIAMIPVLLLNLAEKLWKKTLELPSMARELVDLMWRPVLIIVLMFAVVAIAGIYRL